MISPANIAPRTPELESLVDAQLKKLGASRGTMTALKDRIFMVDTEAAVAMGTSVLENFLDVAYGGLNRTESRHGHTCNSKENAEEYFTYYREAGYDIAGSELNAESAVRLLSLLGLTAEDRFLDLGSASGRHLN